MTIHRFIFRLDYNLKYKIVDSPGRIMELLAGVGTEFWDGIQDSQKDRQIGARYSFGTPVSEYRTLTVQPQTIAASVESAHGFEDEDFSTHETVRNIVKLVEDITAEFKIQDVVRAGLRFYDLSNVGGGAAVLEPFKSGLDGSLVRAIEARAGAISDVGLAFNGADGRSKYHLNFGPFCVDELRLAKYFEKISDSVRESAKANLIFDVDLYEENFSFKGRDPGTWIRAQASAFSKIRKDLSSVVPTLGAKK